jgi:multimeric flavodoxin WrbA
LGNDLRFKPGASVVVCRRGGASAAFDRLNKYFTILNMPIVSSQYWNMAYGQTPGQVLQDEEGMQTMRTLGRNMAWMIRKLNVSEDGHPELERPQRTNFIR